MILVSLGLFMGGLVIVVATLLSAVRSFVVPRSENVWLTRKVARAVYRLFLIRLRWLKGFAARDRLMSLYAPITLLLLPFVWAILLTWGYMLMYWALGVRPWYDAFLLSGSSLLTLGYAPVVDLPTMILSFSEALVGLGLVALLIAYLPTMYSAFQAREEAVTLLEVRAGLPPSAVEMIERFHRIQTLQDMQDVWVDWEHWFVNLEESHTSLAMLVFFRSPHPRQSWVNAAAAVLDAAALHASTLQLPPDPRAQLCIRAGFVALRKIGAFYGVSFDPDPRPTDPISVPYQEFVQVYERLQAGGVPVRPDREQAWRDFAGWRVNYDGVLNDLARLTMTPYPTSLVQPRGREPHLVPVRQPLSE